MLQRSRLRRRQYDVAVSKKLARADDAKTYNSRIPDAKDLKAVIEKFMSTLSEHKCLKTIEGSPGTHVEFVESGYCLKSVAHCAVSTQA